MSFKTIPVFVVDTEYGSVQVHPVDLKSIAKSLIVSPGFLTAIAGHDKPYIRAVAAEHVNTPKDVLVALLNDSSLIVSWAAMDNPHTPFEAILFSWYKKVPEGTLWDSPAVVDRHEDVLEFLARYNITEEESRSIPSRWIIRMIQEDA